MKNQQFGWTFSKAGCSGPDDTWRTERKTVCAYEWGETVFNRNNLKTSEQLTAIATLTGIQIILRLVSSLILNYLRQATSSNFDIPACAKIWRKKKWSTISP